MKEKQKIAIPLTDVFYFAPEQDVAQQRNKKPEALFSHKEISDFCSKYPEHFSIQKRVIEDTEVDVLRIDFSSVDTLMKDMGLSNWSPTLIDGSYATGNKLDTILRLFYGLAETRNSEQYKKRIAEIRTQFDEAQKEAFEKYKQMNTAFIE